jgi:hypothetical protein
VIKMGFFTRKCAYCGMKLDNHASLERMGKKFCSDEHAEKYWEYRNNSQDAHSGC